MHFFLWEKIIDPNPEKKLLLFFVKFLLIFFVNFFCLFSFYWLFLEIIHIISLNKKKKKKKKKKSKHSRSDRQFVYMPPSPTKNPNPEVVCFATVEFAKSFGPPTTFFGFSVLPFGSLCVLRQN